MNIAPPPNYRSSGAPVKNTSKDGRRVINKQLLNEGVGYEELLREMFVLSAEAEG